MSTFEKIDQLRKDNKIHQITLTNYLGISKSIYNSWANGSNNSYTKHLPKIAKFFGVKIEYFYDTDISNQMSSDEITLLKNYRILKSDNKSIVFSLAEQMARAEISRDISPQIITVQHSMHKVSAGVGYTLIDSDSFESIEVIETDESRKADFALTITGDSMSPKYNDGDVVLVRQQPAVNENDICIYIVNGDGYIKKFRGDRLISLNPKYDDIMLTENDEYKCCGLVLGKAVVIE